jgi:hypothetical protein
MVYISIDIMASIYPSCHGSDELVAGPDVAASPFVGLGTPRAFDSQARQQVGAVRDLGVWVAGGKSVAPFELTDH